MKSEAQLVSADEFDFAERTGVQQRRDLFSITDLEFVFLWMND